MTDDDRLAFGPAPAAQAMPPAPARPRRRGLWRLAALLVLGLGLVAALLVARALPGPDEAWTPDLHLQIDGNDGGTVISADGLSLRWEQVGLLVAGLAAAAVVVAVILPVALLLGLLAAALGVGLALLALLGLSALALAPLWGTGLLLWLVLRRRRPPA